MGDEACIIQLDSMREIYIMALPNLKAARDKCSLPVRDQDKAEFKNRRHGITLKPKYFNFLNAKNFVDICRNSKISKLNKIKATQYI